MTKKETFIKLKTVLMEKVKKDSLTNGLRIFSEASGLGFVLAVPPVLGVILGFWLDQRFETKPYLTISLLVLGLILGIIQTLRIVKRYLK